MIPAVRQTYSVPPSSDCLQALHSETPTQLQSNLASALSSLRLNLYQPHPSVDIWAGESLLTHDLAERIASQGFSLDPDAPIKVLIDIPTGILFHAIEVLNGTDRSHLHLVAVTFNICPEYCEDIWDLQPNALIVDPKSDADLISAILRLSSPTSPEGDKDEEVRGERYRSMPSDRTLLDCKQRQILYWLARGLCNGEIALQLNLNQKTITNTLTYIYDKLNVKNREAAILYYWGISTALSLHCYQ